MRMLNRFVVLSSGLFSVVLALPMNSLAQKSPDWLVPMVNSAPVAEKDKKPAPRRSLVGFWGSRAGNQSKGVQLHPNDGKSQNEPPYTPYGAQLYKAHKPTEGKDEVPPSMNNDPRMRCEPLGLPRYNHYDLGVQIFQDEYKVAILYQYDNRWRFIWTDGRPLPKLVDGGVEAGGEYRDQRWMGYSVGKWLDDYTLEIKTIGTRSEDRVWLDNTGRPVSDQLVITETLRRLDYDTLEWSETLVDPKIYTRPWETMKLPLRLQDPRMDFELRYCSPTEQENYMKTYGRLASGQ